MSNRGKLAAGASAAVVTVGGGVAHLSGAFRTTADDIGRGAGRGINDVPPPEVPPPRDPPAPKGGAGEAVATDDLVREWANDVQAKEVICFASQNFRDETTGKFVAPSETEFVNSAAEQFAPAGSQLSYRLKADSLYEKLSDPETDLEDVAIELACF